ncbi:histidine kinase [Agromyces endophyticus]|uniref:sensor histidine kinase n=1 Tax=Agromyces sp. H17E-10 TaxID=2932244 RepID=UPI001FD1943E|nr:histidine kinase [Agromyces sp. H17E-10]UOQ89495.1 histidine kinase [Agromyces sp. H17E-10]
MDTAMRGAATGTTGSGDGAFSRWIRRHRPLIDAGGIAVLSVVAAAVGIGEIWNAISVLPEPVSQWWGVALSLPAVVCVALKRRHARIGLAIVSVLCFVALFTVGGIGTLVALLDLLWTVTVGAGATVRRRILAACIAATVTITGLALVVTGDGRIAVLVGLQLGALLGTDYWWATAVAQANELAALHRREAREVMRLAERDRQAALQRERDGMARELHDLVAGHVSAMAIRAEAALSSDREPGADGAALRAVRDSSLEAHEALRSMITVLRAGGGELVVPPRFDRVPGFVDEARRAGLEVTVDGPPAALVPSVPAAVEQLAARIVQESLANCARHAAGGRVAVAIEVGARSLDVRVDSQDGRPLERPSLPGNGTGLAMLDERVRAFGGRFSAGPDGSGWSVRATIPVAA